jgi:hypothetical protein
MVTQAFGEESISLTWIFEWLARFRADRKKARKMRRKVKSMLLILFYIQGIIHKEFVLAGQRGNSAYYCDVSRRLLENLRRFRRQLSYKRTDCYITTTHSVTLPFSPGIFFPKNMTAVVHPPNFYVSPIEEKTKTEMTPF